MTMDDLLDDIYNLKVERANVSREIDDLQNIVDSITERLEELSSHSEKARSSQDWRDNYARARDKRRLTRDQISENRQKLRYLDARIETIQLHMEYGEIEGG